MYMTNKKEKSSRCHSCLSEPTAHPERDFIKDSKHGVILCSQCIEFFHQAQDQIKGARQNQNEHDTISVLPEVLPFPEEIYKVLSEHVIGQDEAKKTVAIAVAHHYRRLRDPSIGKSNILLIGPTGTGKTEIARAIAGYLKVPFVAVDATAFTSKGYVGEDVDSSIQRLLAASQYNIPLAERGIVFIDEIDKIARRGNGMESGVGTTAVQQELLRLMEGDSVKITRNINGMQEIMYVNTSKILFICSGAFVGLEEMVLKGSQKTIGLNSSAPAQAAHDLATGLEARHLNQFGMIPEFLGRLPVIAVTYKLTIDEMMKILTEPKNSIINQYKKLFEQDKAQLDFSKEFLQSVVDEAIKKEIGARGLRQIIEKRMKPLFYRINEFVGHKVMMNATDYFSTLLAPKDEKAVKAPTKKETKPLIEELKADKKQRAKKDI